MLIPLCLSCRAYQFFPPSQASSLLFRRAKRSLTLRYFRSTGCVLTCPVKPLEVSTLPEDHLQLIQHLSIGWRVVFSSRRCDAPCLCNSSRDPRNPRRYQISLPRSLLQRSTHIRKVLKTWNRLPKEIIEQSSVEQFARIASLFVQFDNGSRRDIPSTLRQPYLMIP